jgi:Tfp pilus assembly protein PilF
MHGDVYSLADQDLFGVAAAIARDAARSVGGTLTEARDPPLPADAYARYWRAKFAATKREHDALRAARDMLKKLVADYPSFAEAHAALADIYAHKTGEHLGLPRVDTFAEAELHLSKAVSFAGETAATLVTGSLLAFYRDQDFASALKSARKSTELESANSYAWQTRAMVASAAGRDDEALKSAARALALDPLRPDLLWDNVWFLYVAGRYADAAVAAKDAEAISPPIEAYLALIAEARGDEQVALSHWVKRAQARGLALKPEAVRDYGDLLAAMDGEPDYKDGGAPLAFLLLKLERRDDAIKAMTAGGGARDNWMLMWARRLPGLESVIRDPAVAPLLPAPIEA